MVKVKSIMKNYVVTVGPEATLSDVAKVMSNNKIGSLVVVEKGKPVGMVTDSDIVNTVAAGKDPAGIRISGLKNRRGLISVSSEDGMMDAIKIMIQNNVKRLPVIDKGRLVGIVTEKELLVVSPELVEILSEKLKARISMGAKQDSTVSGTCEDCGDYSDELKSRMGKWVCPDCKDR